MGKRSIDFTKERTERINRLIDLMGIRGVYGEIPKALDFGVILAIHYIKNLEKITPDINDDNMRFLFNSIIKRKKEREKAEKREIKADNIPFVTPTAPEK